jgi:DAK2 domain fusion protein YloV
MHHEPEATLDVPTILRFAEIALTALGEAREEIDALNVYPVPDADTGTNLFLTLESARNGMLEAVQDGADADVRAALAAFSRGALLGARGSSGVILSQLLGALSRRVETAGPAERAALVFAEGLALATEACYAAVGRPVEGTILTVARAASEAAQRAASLEPSRLGHVVRAAAEAARQALARTPDQLQALKDAGVVDAGGCGLCVLLDAAETAVTGRRPVDGQPALGAHVIPVPHAPGDLAADGPAYEVMYLLDAPDERIPALRAALAPLGDSLVVVGGEGLWNVHVHVDDVGAAVEAGVEAGRPYRIRVTHFAEQADRQDRHPAYDGLPERTGRVVVVLSAGVGLRDLFARAGAYVLPVDDGSGPTTDRILEAVRTAAASEVVVLPNDRGCVAAAEAAARTARSELGIRVAVIPTVAQVQGLAALAVHEPGRGFEQDVLEMTAAARHARSGGVTRATSRAMTSAGPCEPGDVLGEIEGDFVLVGDDLFTVAVGVLERLLGGGGELVTVVAGAGAGDLAGRCSTYLSSAHPSVDVVVYDGGQEGYPLLVAVE